MGFRFQKRIKVLPGVRLNISKSGVSTSLGGRGATVNIGKNGVRTTVGVPGTGLSWSEYSAWTQNKSLKPSDELQKLASFLDKLAQEFNAMSPRINKASATWNKALASYKSTSRHLPSSFVSLGKAHQTALAEYQYVADEVQQKQKLVSDIEKRLKGMSFGLFGGKLRSARNKLLALAAEHHDGAARLLVATASVSAEVVEEFLVATKTT